MVAIQNRLRASSACHPALADVYANDRRLREVSALLALIGQAARQLEIAGELLVGKDTFASAKETAGIIAIAGELLPLPDGVSVINLVSSGPTHLTLRDAAHKLAYRVQCLMQTITADIADDDETHVGRLLRGLCSMVEMAFASLDYCAFACRRAEQFDKAVSRWLRRNVR